MSITFPMSAVIWAAVVGTGFYCLTDYEMTPGSAGEPSERWPAASGLQREPRLPTLVMLAHPRCPCTRASISELERLVAACRERAQVHVLFLDPDGSDVSWDQTDLWRTAAAIPGVQVSRDQGGRLADTFGVSTSGHVLLYDRAGELRFSGGITASRGHAGDNLGRSALFALISGSKATADRTPVFGCGLSEEVCPEPGRAQQ